MSLPELEIAGQQLRLLAVKIAPTLPEAARVMLDACELVNRELLCRAFGGSAAARRYAAKVHDEKARREAN